MRLENTVPTIILACGLVQIILGISFFLDYGPIIGIGWVGGAVTSVSIMALVLLNSRSKNKGEVFDERLRTRWFSLLGLCYGITNIGIALTINSVFYNVGAIKGVEVLIYDIVGFLFVGWGIPLVLLALGEFAESRKA